MYHKINRGIAAFAFTIICAILAVSTEHAVNDCHGQHGTPGHKVECERKGRMHGVFLLVEEADVGDEEDDRDEC